MILLAVACLVLISCGPRAEKAPEVVEQTTCDELTPEQQTMFDNWANYAGLEQDAQKAIVLDMKVYIDDCHAKCEAKCKAAQEEGATPEKVCPEKEAKCADFKAKWDAFDNLPLEEQKALLDQALECMKEKCCKEKETCEKE